MSDTERIAATSQGGMTGLFDDFFDKQYLSDESIQNILNEHNTGSKRSNEKLFSFFYRSALEHVPDRKKMIAALVDVYNAQLESKKQTQETITKKETENITLYKGGASLLFYRTAFLPSPSAAEEKMIYDLGGMMQLCNDIFDVYKDRDNKIKTLVTEAEHIKPVRELLQHQLMKYYALAYEIGFVKQDVNKFLSILSLGIFSRAFVCLDQLEKNETLTQDKFDVKLYSRKQLICDMDTIKNKLRSARYHATLMK